MVGCISDEKREEREGMKKSLPRGAVGGGFDKSAVLTQRSSHQIAKQIKDRRLIRFIHSGEHRKNKPEGASLELLKKTQ